MPTPFATDIWQHATFTFTAQQSPVNKNSVDPRGNIVSQPQKIAITFKMSPASSGEVEQQEAAVQGTELYDCRITAINGDPSKVILQSDIRLGDLGVGTLGDRKCYAIIKSIAQSSTSPITARILGSKVRLEIDYRLRGGSEGNAQV